MQSKLIEALAMVSFPGRTVQTVVRRHDLFFPDGGLHPQGEVVCAL
jgi:hypothetical protein